MFSGKNIFKISALMVLLIGFSGYWANAGTKDTIAGRRIVKVLLPNGASMASGSSSILQGKDGLFYLGIDDVLIYNEPQNQWTSFNSFDLKFGPFESVQAINQSPDGKIWASSRHGHLSSYDGTEWVKFEQFEGDGITAMFPSKRNGLWFAVMASLVHYDGKNWASPISAFKAIAKIKSGPIFQGLEDSEGLLWIGVKHGILKYDESKTEWVSYLDSKTLMFPKYILEDTEKNLWFANTQGDVAIYERKNDSWITFNLSNKISNGGSQFPITGMIESRGQILFATRNGLLTYDSSTKKWASFTPQNSGLPALTLTCIYKDTSERIWIGTPKGILVLEASPSNEP